MLVIPFFYVNRDKVKIFVGLKEKKEWKHLLVR